MVAEDLISRYDQTAGNASAKWRELMIAVGSLVASEEGHLPPALRERLIEVNLQWAAGAVSEQQLLAVKRECWTFLESKHGNSYSIADREDRTVRAMLCLLEPAGDELTAEYTAGWVEDMLGPEPFPRN